MTHKPDDNYYNAKVAQAQKSSDELYLSLVEAFGQEEGAKRFVALTNKAYSRSDFEYTPKELEATI